MNLYHVHIDAILEYEYPIYICNLNIEIDIIRNTFMLQIRVITKLPKNIFDIYVTEYGTALTTILPILFLYLNTAIVTAGTFEP
jgi:hypothetical protein